MLGTCWGYAGQASSVSLVPWGIVRAHRDGAVQALTQSSVLETLGCLVQHCSEAWREEVGRILRKGGVLVGEEAVTKWRGPKEPNEASEEGSVGAQPPS